MENSNKRINIGYAVIERRDKGKMCSAMADMPPCRTTDVKIKMKTNGIFHGNICFCPEKGSDCD